MGGKPGRVVSERNFSSLEDDYTKGPEENSRKCGTEWVQSPQGLQQDVVIVHQGAKETV